MNSEKTDQEIRSYLPIDRGEYAITGYRGNEARILVGIRPDVVEEIAEPFRAEYMAGVKEVIERHGDLSQIDNLRSQHAAKLRDAKIAAHNSGRLKEWTAIDVCRPFAGNFSEMCFNGFEVSHGQQLLPHGSHPVKVTYREWIHDRGRITREQIKQHARDSRPAWTRTVGDANEFERNFTPEVKIKEAEAAAARRESKRHEISAGPQHLIGKQIER